MSAASSRSEATTLLASRRPPTMSLCLRLRSPAMSLRPYSSTASDEPPPPLAGDEPPSLLTGRQRRVSALRSGSQTGAPIALSIVSREIPLTPERAEDLVFVHSNLRHLSRRTDAYKTGETRMWDVGGDSFDSLGGIGILEVADLSLDEPKLQAVSFGLDDP
ncbi:unnamed protein product [Miscanthus lutarioriparius]|uniref:Uncharacterized protein n=1 Tax=Miscanthus lutarioriparius TaxID=422564 RepID=A0A811PHP8_9POAL|nr:unnamed protein product [Miscanthus lutarioriparius]